MAVGEGRAPATISGHRGLDHEEPLLFEVGRREITGVDFPDVALENDRLGGMRRRTPIGLAGLTEPEVYVDGLRGADTCILNNLVVSDVRRVEVYSQGVTGRPGYVTSARGLILIFTRNR